MVVHVRLFAILKDRIGKDAFDLELPADATVGDAIDLIARTYETIRLLLKRCAPAVNQTYARHDALLNDGDELALIPPVSGG